MFTGAIAYADDIALMAPSIRAMRQMLKLCEQYAKDFDVLFNANKSKCIISHPHSKHIVHSNTTAISFYICGKKIDVVDKWPHLGHIVSKDGDDRSDILNRRGSFIGQANNVICWFGKLDCRVKTKLLKAYCSSFYGSELWDFFTTNRFIWSKITGISSSFGCLLEAGP